MSETPGVERNPHPYPRVRVSRCLRTEPARSHGGHRRSRPLTEVLDTFVEWAPIWPEDEIGMGVREKSELEHSGDCGRVVGSTSAADPIEASPGSPKASHAELATFDGYVLKDKSPNRDLFGLPVFAEGNRVDGTEGDTFVQLSTTLSPQLPNGEHGRLCEERQRKHFVERIYAHARLREMFGCRWRPRDLVAFHTRHKLQLMAHSPKGYRTLGQIVARAGSSVPEELQQQYRDCFQRVLALPTTPGRHVNVLHHAFGMVSDLLSHTPRQDILAAVESYRDGTVPLSLPVLLLRQHSEANATTWLAGQTYLEPFPREVGLRNTLVQG